MSFFMVDVEADGQIPGEYSMICLGAVIVRGDLAESFYGRLKPISNNYTEALRISGFSREETLSFDDPQKVMFDFDKWIKEKSVKGACFISDNNGFDWQFVNWYFHKFVGSNPFGHSSQNLGSLYKGFVRTMRKNHRHLCKTRHTHNPVDDARGNAEALMEMKNMGFDVNLV